MHTWRTTRDKAFEFVCRLICQKSGWQIILIMGRGKMEKTQPQRRCHQRLGQTASEWKVLGREAQMKYRFVFTQSCPVEGNVKGDPLLNVVCISLQLSSRWKTFTGKISWSSTFCLAIEALTELTLCRAIGTVVATGIKARVSDSSSHFLEALSSNLDRRSMAHYYNAPLQSCTLVIDAFTHWFHF